MPDMFTLSHEAARARAVNAVINAHEGYVVTIAEPSRSQAQNRKLWPMLTDIRKAKPLGREHTTEQWKAILMRAHGAEIGYLLDVNGEPFPIGYRSSKMGKRAFADFIEFIYAFGAEHGVQWSEPKQANPLYERTG